MRIFREMPPTAGYGISLKEILGPRRQGSLEDDFQHFLGLPYAAVTYSGTAALYFILETLKKFSPKTTVIIPSFICPIVTLAIIKAGLKIKVCDIQPDRFDYNDQELRDLCQDNHDVLAVLAVHLAGIPVDIKKIKEITQRYNIFLIEDCAQALGASVEDQMVGTWGDFAFFSLCRGKGLTIYEGGVLVTRHEKYTLALKETTDRLEKKDPLSEILKIVELLGYAVFYRPFLFWFVFNLPQQYWRMRQNPVRAMGEYYLDFDYHQVGSFRKSVGHDAFHKIETEISDRRQKAHFYREGLKRLGLDVIAELPHSKAVYPYVSVIIKDENRRQQILNRINRLGLGASIIYLKAINEYDHLKNFISLEPTPNGQYLAQHTLTLSTSTYLTQQDLLRVIDNFAL